MKLRLSLLGVLAGLVALGAAGAATSANNRPACGGGKMIVNVTYGLYNDYDSGVGGNAWANDTINRHLQVYDQGSGTYCAVVNDTGSILTFAGESPGGTGTVSAGIKGTINGGYTTTVFTGTLASNPPYKTNGNLGNFDLQCTDAYTCPGAHPGYYSYFSSTSGDDLASWSWYYHTAKNGDWTNAAAGNVGDITG